MEENQEKKITKEEETKENPNQEQKIEVKNEEQHILEQENKSETSLIECKKKKRKGNYITGTIGALFGGVVIFLDKPFKVGDYIQANTYAGTVEDITFRSTAIRTIDDSLLHIPNSEMSAVAITNWSEINKRRYSTNLLLTLETPLEKVVKVKKEIIEMLLEQEELYTDTIRVNFENILDNGIQLVVAVYTTITDFTDYLKLKEKLNYQVMQILEKNSVELAYNTQTVYVKK